MNQPSDFWKNWRKRTGALTWRIATAADLPAITELRAASERLTHQKQRDPNLLSMPVLLTLVAEDDLGNMVDALYLEAQVELVKIGCDTLSFEELGALEQDLSAWLRSIGIRTVLAKTLVEHKDRMTEGLQAMGMDCTDGEFSHWRRNL